MIFGILAREFLKKANQADKQNAALPD